MGALHAGHAALIRVARAEQRSVVVSLYVNPRQFSNPQDLARYPRDLAADTHLAAASGADLLFAPSDDEMYPPGDASGIETTPEPGPLATRLEGAARPGHFAGVAAAVTRLFDLVAPEVAYFGEKDAQQVRVVEWICARRTPPLRIRRVATVRDLDGLALSSRNARLSETGRTAARAIPQALAAIKYAHAAGERRIHELHAAAVAAIHAVPTVTLDYLDFADDVSLEPLAPTGLIADAGSGRVLVSIAAEVEGVRLIDAATLRA
jgi:pantoate--beta-alanine ligase